MHRDDRDDESGRSGPADADDFVMLSDEELLEGLAPHVQATLRRWMTEVDEQKRRRDRARRVGELATPRVRRRTRPLAPGDERGTSATLAVRLPRWVEEQIRRHFQELEVTPSQGLRQILEEWCVERLFPALEHRDDGFLRLAAIRGGPSVVEWVAAGSPGTLDPDVREQVLDYAELFGGRIDAELYASGSPRPTSSISRSALVEVATPGRRR